MVRGCQKKIIYLKNTKSNMFEEAYFIIRNGLPDEEQNECDMVKEANRILNESFELETRQTALKKVVHFFKRHIITFSCGILFGSLIAFLILR